VAVAEYTLSELDAALQTLGVTAGDTVLVHSSLLHLGRIKGCETTHMTDRIVDSLTSYLGPTGTLVTLSPWYDYSNKGVPFDTRHSPVSPELGVLSVAVAARAEAERSANPMFSLAAIGRHADYICNGPNASAFGADSAWDRFVSAGGKVLLLGSDVQRMTLIRYAEQRFGVPYLYIKMFRTPILRNGRTLPFPVTALLRFAKIPLRYNLVPFIDRLRAKGLFYQTPLGGGLAQVTDARDCVREGIDSLNENMHVFLAEPPPYNEGEIPLQ
jgi:aminoglycoside 3-N-acetyltransferase